MKEDIISTAADMFLTLGFKSVTMDDIASKMGISKKTIYANFSTKNKLVQATTIHILQTIEAGIENIKAKENNAIVELYEIKKFVMHHLKDEKSSPQYQLSKYYPKVYKSVQENHLSMMHCSVADNLRKGIEGGLYRASIPVEFISKIYFLGMMGIKNSDFFPVDQFPLRELTENFLEYHLRAIVTPKGLQTLNEILTLED